MLKYNLEDFKKWLDKNPEKKISFSEADWKTTISNFDEYGNLKERWTGNDNLLFRVIGFVDCLRCKNHTASCLECGGALTKLEKVKEKLNEWGRLIKRHE